MPEAGRLKPNPAACHLSLTSMPRRPSLTLSLTLSLTSTAPPNRYLSELGLAVCFAGPVGTADDLIARAVPCFANAIVITADAGLAKRCRSAARGRLQVIAPQPFLASLAQACAASDEARSPEIGELGGGELLLSEALGLPHPPSR